MDVLLTGWWWVKRESASTISGSNPSWVYLLVGSIQLTSSTLWAVSTCRTAQRYCFVYSLSENKDPVPKLYYCFLTVPPWSLHSFPSLISASFNLPTGTQERSWRLNEAYFLQSRNEGQRKVFMTGCPTGFCSVLFVIVKSLSYVEVFVTPRTAASQASVSFTIFWSLLKLTSIESVMPSNHLILSFLSPPAFSLSQNQDLF